jgi:hypothetical protein
MRNPLRDQSPSDPLEWRIAAVLKRKGSAHAGSAAELEAVTDAGARRWRRAGVLAMVAVLPLLALAAVAIVEAGSQPLNLLDTSGSAEIPQGTGHSAPVLASTRVAAETPHAAPATAAAIVPTPTITIKDGRECASNTNAQGLQLPGCGTPIHDDATPAPTPSSAR